VSLRRRQLCVGGVQRGYPVDVAERLNRHAPPLVPRRLTATRSLRTDDVGLNDSPAKGGDATLHGAQRRTGIRHVGEGVIDSGDGRD